MPQAFCIIRSHGLGKKYGDPLYWGTIRSEGEYCFSYDTQFFDTIKEVQTELKSFAKWKGLRIKKYTMEV